MPKGKRTEKARDRQATVATLWWQGNNKATIIEKTGYPLAEVTRHLKVIRYSLTPKTEEVLHFRRNKVRNKINLVQQKAWDIIKKVENESIGKDSYRIALIALSRITSSQELEAKVEGITQEKLVVGPEEEASKLLSDVKMLEEKRLVAQKTEGSVEDVEKETPLPDFLKGMDEIG